MEETTTDDLEVTQKDEEQVEALTDDADTSDDQQDTTDTDETDWKAEALKFKAILDRQAKKKVQPVKSVTPAQPEAQTLTQFDTIALIKANVTEPEDISEVVDYAKLKSITVRDALQSNVIKSLLREKSELRQTAQATNTQGSRRSPARLSDEALVENASKGKFTDDPEELAKARMALNKKK